MASLYDEFFPFQVCVISVCNKTESTDYFNVLNEVTGLLVFKFAHHHLHRPTPCAEN